MAARAAILTSYAGESGLTSNSYAETYGRSVSMPEEFWLEAAGAGWWQDVPRTALDMDGAPAGAWFPDATTNMCVAALDRHIDEGRGNDVALIHESAYEHRNETFSFSQLRDRVAKFAGALIGQGVKKGDPVVIYMPMIPDAVVAMLACARIGAPHSVVFGGFAGFELASRIDDCRPKAIVASSCGLEPGRVVPYAPMLSEALSIAKHAPAVVVVKQREVCRMDMADARFVDFDALVEAAAPAEAVIVPSTHPLYILYTSGTTGNPKGLVRDTGGYMTALTWSMRNIYGAKAGDVFWAASDIGWVVGHSYIVYGPLLSGCATILYEGKPVGTPDAGAYWRLVEKHGVSILFTAPTALRAIKRDDFEGEWVRRSNLGSLRALFLAGERADPDTVKWATHILGKPVIDHWWQTELGWPALSSFPGLGDHSTKLGSAGRAVPGFIFHIVDDEGSPVREGSEGTLLIKQPLPPGCSPTLWNADDRFRSVYLDDYPGYYLTGDAAMRDADGFIHVMGRTDDVINVAGHRLSTGAMEEILAEDADVAECAVVGAADKLKGQAPIGLIVLKAGRAPDPAEIEARLVKAVRDRIGPVAAFKQVTIVLRLPKTRSGKVLRRTMRAIADGRPYSIPPTIDDPAALDEIKQALTQPSTVRE
ncbi:AMP-binding protein [Sphingobium sp. 15-1]|uniref:AMP-binding protein n=1 Tax=Sphingobium sp. 15-1 TaxID=2729616 RepID=UPI0021009492|nr:AMP-binding protein [Sphingobium sp. 15-1]